MFARMQIPSLKCTVIDNASLLGPNWPNVSVFQAVPVASTCDSQGSTADDQPPLKPVDEFVEFLHKGYTSFCSVVSDKQLVDSCSALPVIISLSVHVPGSASKKSQSMCRQLKRSRVFGVTKSSKLCCEAWLAVKVISCLDCSAITIVHFVSIGTSESKKERPTKYFMIDTTGVAQASFK